MAEKNTKLVCLAELPHNLVPELMKLFHDFEQRHGTGITLNMIGVSKLTKEEFLEMAKDGPPEFVFNLDTGVTH